MDIQEMVNARILELRNQALGANLSSCEAPVSDNNDQYRLEELAGLSVRMDNDLSEIAGLVLEITERVSDDFMRLEKELLDSRLAMLQHVESVLDMTLTLKKQAARVIAKTVSEARIGPRTNRIDDQRRLRKVESEGPYISGRASMVNQGVADLFRRTQS
ncbi:MAG: hypothetical protein ACYCXF_05705 [Thermoleophilia bacterium]